MAGETGMFVEVPNDPRLFGKLVALDDLGVEVEFFYSVHRREITRFDHSEVKRGYLHRQTRVYFQDSSGNGWRTGRVRDFLANDGDTVTYEVRAPNSVDIDVDERNLWVRCFAEGDDPSSVLAMGAGESQYLFDVRDPLRRRAIAFESAACGLSGMMSSSITLLPHQLSTCQRILTDPIQRYLLADEVGLGKTIEACSIVRQTMLDDPSATALIVVPKALVQQWKLELKHRFALDPDKHPRIRLVSFEMARGLTSPTIMVVDEAHQCLSNIGLHQELVAASSDAEKLLLLSATPPIGAEKDLLALLQWLDPERWSRETEASFRDLANQTQNYGRLLLSLRSDASDFILKRGILAARSVFADDAIVEKLSSDFLESQVRADHISICNELKEHIADTYRIHHRLIRKRRADLAGWEFRERGPGDIREEMLNGDEATAFTSALEEWRLATFDALRISSDLEGKLAERYILLLDLWGRGRGDVSHLTSLFVGEGELLAELTRSARLVNRDKSLAWLVQLVERQIGFLRRASTNAVKLVLFTSNDADELRQFLASRIDTTVASIQQIEDFTVNPSVELLVLGRDGEDGLNLQFADAIIHLDLPFDLVRLEQRIGRLDRFGRTKPPIKQVIVVPDDDEFSPWSCWLETLKSAFEIFDDSLSELHLVLDDIMSEMARKLLREGVVGLSEYHEEIRKRLQDEREKLNEQYALDALAFSASNDLISFDEIDDLEADEDALFHEMRTFVKAFGFEERSKEKSVIELAWGRNTLLPARPWQDWFDSTLQRKMTAKRELANVRNDVDLLRPGNECFDTIQRVMEWDDRGRSFATWRFRPGLGSVDEERIIFKLSWVISAGNIAGRGLLRDPRVASAERFAGAFFRTRYVSQYIDLNGKSISDPDLLRCLDEPYRQEFLDDRGRDYNLSSRHAWLEAVISQRDLAHAILRASHIGSTTILESDAYQGAVRQANADLDRFLKRHRVRDVIRKGLGQSPARQSEFDLDVVEAVRKPEIVLDSAGLFVLAGYWPKGGTRASQ